MLDEILEISAWYPPLPQSDTEQVVRFQSLVATLERVSPIFTNLLSKNDPDDPGVRLSDPGLAERFVEWHAAFSKEFPQDAEIKLLVGAKPFLGPDGEIVSSYRVVLTWGIEGGLETLKIEMPMRFAEVPDAAALFAAIVDALTGWRSCALVTGAPSVLKMSGKLFPEHHSSGFGIWLPALSGAVELGDAHSVTALNGGHLIITSPEMFNLANKDALERLHRVDGHLMESGNLPGLAAYPLPI